MTRGVANLPTSFIAEWGSGKPIIGILAEYDALPGLSPVKEGAPGHGCGHNLLGTASVYAGIAVKKAMERSEIKGTVRVYGCPAEEILYGKVIMAAAGVFNDLDAAIQWHPWDANSVPYGSANALDNKIYKFHGKAAHAGAYPWEGRSALDAAMLFTEAIERIREHMWEKDRIHYIITKGGNAPNIVPDYAEVWVFVRSPDMRHFIELTKWVDAAAIGASLATQTTVEIERKVGTHILLPNKTLSLVAYKNMELVGPPKFTEEEKRFVKEKLSRPYEVLDESLTPPKGWEVGGEWIGLTGSTDVGDVSWITPTTGMIMTACVAKGTPAHSIDWAKQVSMSIGHKGMLVAAKVIALTALDLLLNPEVLKSAWDEFEKRKRMLKWEYKPLVPAKIEYPKYSLEAKEVPLKTSGSS